MAANPYTLQLFFSRKPGLNEPVVHTITSTPSDVANAFITNVEDGLSFFDLPRGLGDLYLHPSSFATEDGEDTGSLQVFTNGQPTSLRLNLISLANAANVARVPSQGFKAGTRLGFKQLAV